MEPYVLVHGAWHTGAEMEAVAAHLRKKGYLVHCPTVAGNNRRDDRAKIGLEDAIGSIVSYIEGNDLRNIRLIGHSYGGMVISGVADRLTDRIRRLVYVNAFVPLDGQCLNDMAPPHYVSLFDTMAAANNNAVMLPFEIWREAFINDADLDLAKSAYAKLNPHPNNTFTDKITLKRPLAELSVSKSYVNCRQDISLPHSLPWHPRLSERLGLFRLVECDGSHEMFFSNPARLAQAIEEAARD
ncbi:alpha/beta hydrolase [Bradyrhizobium sp. S3.12.5]|uniref:alpha/beta fold hydrolase n=1 Tax=Bradyrhizobium sp. S3.12.5 TaxID=3156386 RepID=UPI00339782D9